MSFDVGESPPRAGSVYIAALRDPVRNGWALVRTFPRRLFNSIPFGWHGIRGGYDDYTPISALAVGPGGVKYGIHPTTGLPSADYAIPAQGYNRARIIARGTGGEDESFSVTGYIWRDETGGNECAENFQLASQIPADGEWHLEDSQDYLGPWCMIEAKADGNYDLTAVTVTVHFWKE